jgi:photosystem II stability/assembly factor-like uncharacterized protein
MTQGVLYVGTAGTSAWFSSDLGSAWVRPNSSSGLYLESRIWSMSCHPSDPDHLLAGTDFGVYRWSESEQKWTHLPSPMDGRLVWAIAISPHDPSHVIAGTLPAQLYGSHDGGATWEHLGADPNPFSGVNAGPTRVTQILFDPYDEREVWATIEIDSVWRSRDGGATWMQVKEGLVSGDVHGIAIVGGRGHKKIYVTTNKGLHVSRDDGDSWTYLPLDSPWQYCRGIVARADGKVLFLTNGNGPPGSTGRLLRSRDDGVTWEDAGLPGELNSTPWCVATNAADPMLVFAVTNLGQLFRSDNGGESWRKLQREFGEVRSLLWRPTGALGTASEKTWSRDGRAW